MVAEINREGSLLSVFFAQRPVTDYDSARAADHESYARFFHAMLERGVYLPPSGYEAWFLGTAHGDAQIEQIWDGASKFASNR